MINILNSYKKDLVKFRLSPRRGLATVVTAALMLTTVAVLGSAIVAWSNGNLKVFETTLSTSAANNTNKISENLVIENIVFCSHCATSGSNNVINVTLTNTGTEGITVNQIQINNTVIQNYAKATSLPTNILPQNSYTVATQLPSATTWKSKEPDTITVTTSRGSIYMTQAAPP